MTAGRCLAATMASVGWSSGRSATGGWPIGGPAAEGRVGSGWLSEHCDDAGRSIRQCDGNGIGEANKANSSAEY